MPKSEWLDKLVFRRMTEIHAVRTRMLFILYTWLNVVKEETEKSNNLYLYIDLPRFDFPVIFSELVEFFPHFICLSSLNSLTYRKLWHCPPSYHRLYLPHILQDLLSFRHRFTPTRQCGLL
jgi:hypothetical protein